MIKIKKIISAFTAAALLFALAACSGTGATAANVEKTIQTTASEVEATTQNTSSEDKYVNTTLNARVVEISDGKITVEAMENGGDMNMTPPSGDSFQPENNQGGEQFNGSEPSSAQPDGNSSQPPEMSDGNGGQPPEKPDGNSNQMPEMMNGGGNRPPQMGGGNGGQPPQKPDGDIDGKPSEMDGENGGQPPEKPDGDNSQPPEMGAGNGNQLSFEIDNALVDGISAGDFVTITFGEDGTITSVEKADMMMGGPNGGPGGPQGNNDGAGKEGTSSNSIESDQTVENVSYSSDKEDDNALSVKDGANAVLTSVNVNKTGDSSNTENSDFYGINAAVFVCSDAKATISESIIASDAKGGNGIFVYGEGSEAEVSNSTITTEKNNSGGIMVSGGGTLTADNLTITTQGGSSAAIRSDRGGGTITVNRGKYTSNGSGSPAIYSTADITVNDAELYSGVSQAVVVEGKNSVTLNNTAATGNNTVQNSDKSTVEQAVMIYQSMSGDATQGKGSFTMNGGTLTSLNEGMFFVSNTTADITLKNVELTYATDDLLRIEAAGWGNSGSNGGSVNFYAISQKLKGIVNVDSISNLNLYLTDSSEFEGQIISDGGVYVEIEDGSTWKLTGNSSVSSLSCSIGSINLNGYTLTVNGVEYSESANSTGNSFAF